ncbi:MAG: flagellar basal body rod C-terminal domain-containing protein, partial [Pseudomonadota bacterium]
ETLSDLAAALNAGGLDAFGGVTIGDDGGLVTADGTRLDIVSDSTVRGDSGVAIGGLLGLPVDISDIALDPALAADPGLISSRPGLAESYVGAVGTSESNLSDLVGRAGLMASSAEARAEDATARASLAEARVRDVSGVSLDEEMTKMIAFQNSYAAAARVVSTARDMYDILLQMGR